jgi:hypothetical protein
MLKLTALMFVTFTFGANSFAMGRKIHHLVDSGEWAQATRTLLNGTYHFEGEVLHFGSSDLGRVQAGPFLRLDRKGRSSVVLSTFNGGECRLLSKSREQLGEVSAPTLMKKISCEEGHALRVEAELPLSVAGYGPLTEEGKKILSSVNDVTWRAERPCRIRNSSKVVPFVQDFRVSVGNGEAFIEMESQARAFTFIRLPKNYRSFLSPATIARIFEQRLPSGSYRFFIWSTLSEWQMKSAAPQDLNEDFKMRIAAVNPWMMVTEPASEPVFLEPNRKVCVGQECRDVRFQPFTQVLSFQSLVLEVNPGSPESLAVELNQVSQDLPVAKFRFHRTTE